MNLVTAICVSALILACQVSGRPQENAAAAAATPTTQPSEPKGNVTFLKNEVKPLDGQGSYSYDIELSDGTKLVQSGHTEAPGMGETESSIIIEGSYSYTAPDGKQISITYVADKNGFQPKGDAIPTQGSSSNSTMASEPPAAKAASPPADTSSVAPVAASSETSTAASAPAAPAAPAASSQPAAEASDATAGAAQ